MLRLLCQLVSVTLLGGCYLFHETGAEERDGGRSTGVSDASARERDAGLPEPPRRIDGGFPEPLRDAGSADLCPPRRADMLCVDNPLLPPRMANELPLRFTGCFCDERTTCRLRVDGERIQVETGMCESLADCDACIPEIEVSCELPPLSRGVYQLDVNGSPAADLVVDFDSGLVPPPPVCVMLQEGCPFGSAEVSEREDRFDSACVDARLERGWIELRDSCAECPAGEGICSVTYEERFTDDLPPGGEIRVEAMVDICPVGACDPSCEESVRRCAIPERLMDGGFYRVWLPGDDGPAFTFVGGESTCD